MSIFVAGFELSGKTPEWIAFYLLLPNNEGDSLENVESVKTSNKDDDKCHCFLIVSRTSTGWAVFDPDCSADLTQTSSFQCPWAFIADFFVFGYETKRIEMTKKVIRILVLLFEQASLLSKAKPFIILSKAMKKLRVILELSMKDFAQVSQAETWNFIQ